MSRNSLRGFWKPDAVARKALREGARKIKVATASKAATRDKAEAKVRT